MEALFTELQKPYTQLVDSISVLGLSVKNLRDMLLGSKNSGAPEIIFQLPPGSNVVKQSQMEMIFTEGEIFLETSPKAQKFFSTIVTNEYGEFTHLHCLITYQHITPNIINWSKDRVSNLKFLKDLKNPYPNDENFSLYVPIALCLVTNSRYIDVFREILMTLNSFLEGIKSTRIKVNSIVASVEFMRAACLLLNDLVIPPYDIELNVKIGDCDISIPVEVSSGLLHTEKCIAVLLDLIDIRNIIELWECLLLNKHAFIRSCNEYLLYLILEAVKELLFPLKWSLYIVPVLGPKLIEYMSSPVPILIGINSTQVSVESALKENPSAVILDIDSNILYNSSSSLCDCQTAIISKKLQLAKAYYYVKRDRLSTYRMNSLENNIEDEEFVRTAKTLLTTSLEDREKVFIALIRHIFLDFFIRGLGKFNVFFTYDSFEEHFEFSTEKFLQSIKKCSHCKMEEFWKEFVESSTFQHFLQYEGKCDDSYYRRYFGILINMKNGEYEISNTKSSYVFNIERGISPRQLMNLIKESKDKSIGSFLSDSISFLRLEIVNHLKFYKDYYKSGEVMERYQTPDEVNETYSLYYGKYGIIRVASLLLGHISPEKFIEFSIVNEIILPKLACEINPWTFWETSILQLYYLIKKKPCTWDLPRILGIIRILNANDTKMLMAYQLISGILNEIMGINTDVLSELIQFKGKVGNLARLLIIQGCTPLNKARSEFFGPEELRIEAELIAESKKPEKNLTPANANVKGKRKFSLFRW
ncbi:hypothetical protein SteCoe_33011 [Stentor coeruleus]|uniref:UDENN domain-containing protein n=1 Tax=Stentor coeruleus TaxID=5963 RepID=A0A1R2AY49_9CILI|nr:hypothetical protein SteCoe_33011 [Stentor coeruleus]